MEKRKQPDLSQYVFVNKHGILVFCPKISVGCFVIHGVTMVKRGCEAGSFYNYLLDYNKPYEFEK